MILATEKYINGSTFDQQFMISNLRQFRGVTLSGKQRQPHPDDSVNDIRAPVVINGGAEVAIGQLVDQVVDGLGVEQLLLALHHPSDALVTGHGMLLWSLANPSTHPVGLKITKDKENPLCI